ncbi:MAG: GMC family oxidoreductase N-terminal domain-containing protein [Gammaproteobacteria bacterium]
MNQPTKSCDFLVIGGGSAGAILARRLAEANIGKVVLLESGMSDENNRAILDLSRLDPQGQETEWGFSANPVSGGVQQIQYSRAKMLGGCGNHNDCAFLIPPPSDFDHWASRGANGWGAKEVAPFFKKLENRVDINVAPPISSLSETFIRAGESAGLRRRDFRKSIQPGVGAFPLNVMGSKRQSSSVAYLHPLKALPPNLEVCCTTTAKKLILKGNRATGCLTQDGEIRAHREVLLCCGAIQSPQLMMVSGLGPADQLAEFGIEAVADLPGVGQNLADHAAANIAIALKGSAPEWELTPCEVTMMLQVNDNEPAPDLLYHFVLRMREKYVDYDPRIAGLNGAKISPNVTRPKSRGYLRLRSPRFDDPPEINLNYFSDPEEYDMRTIIKGLRFARKIANTDVFRSVSDREVLPGLSFETDNELAAYVRETCETVYHPAGTCRMGRIDDAMSVVGPDLRVKGVEGLRVCDASVFPSMVTVNINNTVMMVAEKAAELVSAL